MSVQYEFLNVTQDGPVSRLTLTRPEKRNALSLALMQEVIAALEAIPDETQAVVVAGDGPAFPKTSTGKVQKYVLRERTRAGREQLIT